MFDNFECTRCTAGQCKRAKKGRRAEKKSEWKTAGKEKKRAYRHLFKLTSAHPLPSDFQKCQNVRCRRVFKRLPCLFDSASEATKMWLTEVLTVTVKFNQSYCISEWGIENNAYGPYFSVSPQLPRAQGVFTLKGLSQRCAQSIWLIGYRKTCLELS